MARLMFEPVHRGQLKEMLDERVCRAVGFDVSRIDGGRSVHPGGWEFAWRWVRSALRRQPGGAVLGVIIPDTCGKARQWR